MTTPPSTRPPSKKSKQEEIIGKLLVTSLFQSNTSIFVFWSDFTMCQMVLRLFWTRYLLDRYFVFNFKTDQHVYI